MQTKIILPALILAIVFVAGCTGTGNVNSKADPTPATAGPIKEFLMDSFVTFADGKPHPQFSLKDITVNKGDTVRLMVNTKSGTHNINIDELNVHDETPTGKVTTAEFVADKAGDFVYYCSMPGHRQNGHWGTLHVVS